MRLQCARPPPRGLGFLGVELDAAANDGAREDAEIGAARVRTFVITAREDREIARQVRELQR